MGLEIYLHILLMPFYYVVSDCYINYCQNTAIIKSPFYSSPIYLEQSGYCTFIGGFLGSFVKLRESTITFFRSVCPSVSPSVRLCVCLSVGSHMMDFHEIRCFIISFNVTRISGTLHEDEYTFLIISRSFLLIMRNVSDKSCRENQNTHFISPPPTKIVPFMR